MNENLPVVIGIDPNSGPNIEQWSSVLNAIGYFPMYEYESISSIHAAVKGQHKSVISSLLSAGADVNIGMQMEDASHVISGTGR